MNQPMPNKCPLCSGALEVTETSCLDCGVQMRGHFALAPYRNLDAEQIRFLETFLRCRGVIRDMEAALGISYPTVRTRLDALLASLGFADGPFAEPVTPAPMTAAQKAARRKEILAAIENGTLDADAGLTALQALSGDTQ
ncbi:MAG: DUF2089 domain-containing protein [Janthinobacterium lividum]